MLPNKRRSAYRVYLDNATTGGENDENVASNDKVNQIDVQTPEKTKKTKKMSPKHKSAKRGALDKRAPIALEEETGTKTRRSIMSKANKLRRSLQMSGKKKKRARSMAGGSETEKVTVMDKDDSESDTTAAGPVQKKARSSQSATSLASNARTRSTTSINSTASSKRPVSTYNMGSNTSLADTSTIQGETEAETLIKWLLSPVKPKKFFR